MSMSMSCGRGSGLAYTVYGICFLLALAIMASPLWIPSLLYSTLAQSMDRAIHQGLEVSMCIAMHDALQQELRKELRNSTDALEMYAYQSILDNFGDSQYCFEYGG